MEHTEAPHQKKMGFYIRLWRPVGGLDKKDFLARVGKYQLRPAHRRGGGPRQPSEWGLFLYAIHCIQNGQRPVWPTPAGRTEGGFQPKKSDSDIT